ncbi:hypothetical protein E4U53_005016 [Claviceps sorghi]|nr:hypothetical protein E4U53_005016 [Claviceps sorghi]
MGKPMRYAPVAIRALALGSIFTAHFINTAKNYPLRIKPKSTLASAHLLLLSSSLESPSSPR